MDNHFILRRLNPFDLRVNGEGWWYEYSVSKLRVCLSVEGAKNVSWPCLSPLRRWRSVTMSLTGKLVYIWIAISSYYGSVPLTLGLIGRDGGLSALCHSCGFACQQSVLKKFPGSSYLHSEDEVVWLCHLLVNFFIYGSPISSCSDSMPLTLKLIGRDRWF